jgi:glyoxylase-like metal-dependent hydrolase (beta-lactamase superfamily II)
MTSNLIRIINCVAMHPWIPNWKIGAPCILVETDQGLALVDTGLGLHDYQKPSLMVRFFLRDFGIVRDTRYTAICQIEKLGYSKDDLRHIILTHLHFDHAGGVPDFPDAQVHVHQTEYNAMRHPRRLIELAYDPHDFAQPPNWVFYGAGEKVKWFDFDAFALPFKPSMFLVPLFGHTRGLCGVAIQDGDSWIFQCSDALPTNANFEFMPGWISRFALGSHIQRLKSFAANHPEVRMLAGHMSENWFDAEVNNE